jgi:quercetin dioxygenase-like cupin family protein
MKETNVFVSAEQLSWVNVGEGVQRKILGYDPMIMMVCVKFKKGSVGAVHRHPHRQVTFIERGSFEVQIGSRKETLKAGDCYLIPPDVDHGVIALEDSSLVDVFTPAREDFLAAA